MADKLTRTGVEFEVDFSCTAAGEGRPLVEAVRSRSSRRDVDNKNPSQRGLGGSCCRSAALAAQPGEQILAGLAKVVR